GDGPLSGILNLAAETPLAGLDVGLNVVDLVMASVQAANKNHALEAVVPINLCGSNTIACPDSVKIYASVIESARSSAIGVPNLAVAESDENKRLGKGNSIYVNTAQTRVITEIDAAEVLKLLRPLLTVLDSNLTTVANALSRL